jgi:drug/metabolite transporter (DMT)-like permease
VIDLSTQRSALHALLAAALFGVSAPMAKALGADVSPVWLASLFYLGSGLALLLWRLMRRVLMRERRDGAPLARSDFPWLAGCILAGGVAGPLALMWGLRSVSGSSASLLLSMEGLFTTLLAALLFHESVTARVWLAAGLMVSASALLAWPQATPTVLAGSAAIVLACLLWAIDNNLTRKISGGDPVWIAMVKGLSAGTVNAAIALGLDQPLPVWQATATSLSIGALCYGLSLVLFILALRHLGSARTAAHFGTAPFFGAAFAVLVLGEPGSWWLLGAVALMAAATMLVLTERHAHAHRHEPLEHQHAHTHDEHHRHEHSEPWDGREPHSHPHRHLPLRHSHAHLPDLHHRHRHGAPGGDTP